jgi:hypothetical protein
MTPPVHVSIPDTVTSPVPANVPLDMKNAPASEEGATIEREPAER